MAVDRDPNLIWSPLPEAESQPTILPYQWIVHTAVDGPGPTDLGNYFERASVPLESHTWLRWNAHEQFMSFLRRADANFKANRFYKDGKYRGAISTETEDDGTPVERPWNEYQIRELIRFGTWLHRTYGIPIQMPKTWDAPGMGYHSLFPMQWTNVEGKTCPGSTRINQFKNVVLPGIRKVFEAPIQEDEDMAPTEIVYLQNPTSTATHAYVNKENDMFYKFLVDEEGIAAAKFVGVKERNTRGTAYPPNVQKGFIILDGPCKNVSI